MFYVDFVKIISYICRIDNDKCVCSSSLLAQIFVLNTQFGIEFREKIKNISNINDILRIQFEKIYSSSNFSIMLHVTIIIFSYIQDSFCSL